MADVTDVKSVNDLLSQVTEGFSSFFTNLEGTLEKLAGIPSLLNGSNDSLKKTTESAKDASSALDKTHASSLNLLESMKNTGLAAYNAFSAMASGNRDAVRDLGVLNEGVMDVIGSITLMSLGAPTAFNTLNQSSSGVASNINGTLGPALNGLIDILSKYTKFPLLDAFKNFAGPVMTSVDSVNNLENSLLALHGQSGDLSRVFEQTGASQSNLTNLTDEFNNSVKRTAENTGASIPSVVAFTGEVLKIPGLYDNIIKTHLSENIGFVEAAMKVARGTTQNYSDVMAVAATQFEDFNKKGQGPLELMSRMYSVGQTLGIPFNYISSQVKNSADQFKFLGDNTEGALNIIEGLTPKLLESGLGPKAVQELVGGVISSISQLDVAQKSLLSSKTGGAGGLQGGFEIDQLLASGKVDEVYKKMETALKQQFGGKVTTLKEGSESQAGAGQLQKEVAFLTNGPFGSLVKSSAEAYKLLESFKSGQAPTQAKTKEELTEGLNKTVDTGREIDQLQYTELQKIANGIESLKIFSAQQLGKSGREIARTDLGKEQTNDIEHKYSGPNNPDAATNLAYIGADVSNTVRGVVNKVGDFMTNSINTPKLPKSEQNLGTVNQIELNAAKPNNNLTPNLPSTPNLDAAKERQNVLRQKPAQDTVLASHGLNGDQTLTIKVAQIIDGKTEERVLAKARAQSIQLIETSKNDDYSSAVVGHK